MRVLVCGDIHGNLGALRAVLVQARGIGYEAVALLGDIIDYGPHSNEVIETLLEEEKPVLAKIFGNHEDAVLSGRRERFSSDRGRRSADVCQRTLTERSRDYLLSMEQSGCYETTLEGLPALFVHGSMQDPLWGTLRAQGENLQPYSPYSYVFSAHSHLPHVFTSLFPVPDSPETRGKKKTLFLNPGSVGQPRNLNPCAQYALLDTQSGAVSLLCAQYDIKAQQRCFLPEIDAFYRDRLTHGI